MRPPERQVVATLPAGIVDGPTPHEVKAVIVIALQWFAGFVSGAKVGRQCAAPNTYRGSAIRFDRASRTLAS